MLNSNLVCNILGFATPSQVGSFNIGFGVPVVRVIFIASKAALTSAWSIYITVTGGTIVLIGVASALNEYLVLSTIAVIQITLLFTKGILSIAS